MISKSVKLDDDAKHLLDRLQAKVVLSAGRKMSQEELLKTIIRFADEREEELVARVAGVRFPLSGNERKSVLALAGDWGVGTEAASIDETLYGLRKR
jgi:hypothetical protein